MLMHNDDPVIRLMNLIYKDEAKTSYTISATRVATSSKVHFIHSISNLLQDLRIWSPTKWPRVDTHSVPPLVSSWWQRRPAFGERFQSVSWWSCGPTKTGHPELRGLRWRTTGLFGVEKGGSRAASRTPLCSSLTLRTGNRQTSCWIRLL